MSTAAPKPPTKNLLLAAGLSTGTTGGMLAIVVAGQFVFGGIPSERLPIYGLVLLIGTCVSGILGTRYLLQRQRRDAWWYGFSASDEPSGEVIQLSEFRRDDGDTREARSGSPS